MQTKKCAAPSTHTHQRGDTLCKFWKGTAKAAVAGAAAAVLAASALAAPVHVCLAVYQSADP
jgi:hypothetical protein